MKTMELHKMKTVDNIVPSLRGNSSEGVETEFANLNQVRGMVRQTLVGSDSNERVWGCSANQDRRDSPNSAVMSRVEAHSTQPKIVSSKILSPNQKRAESVRLAWASGAYARRPKTLNRVCDNCKFLKSCKSTGVVCDKHIIDKQQKVKDCFSCFYYDNDCQGKLDGICGKYKNALKVKVAVTVLANKSEEAKLASLTALSFKGRSHSEETRKVLSKKSHIQYVNALQSGEEDIRCERIAKTMKDLRNSSEGKRLWKDSGALISANKKEFWSNNPELLKKFLNSSQYRHFPNKPETNVANLKITGLKLTSDGSFFIKLDDWNKNPDFIVKVNGKVIGAVELMDFNYWHKKSEIEPLTNLYNEKGFGCLVIDAKRCYKDEDLKAVKNEIESFISNLSNKFEVSGRSIGCVASQEANEHPVNSVNSKSSDMTAYENTEPSLEGNLLEGVETESANLNLKDTVKQTLVGGNANERVRDDLMGRRDSPTSSESCEMVAEMSTTVLA